MLAGKGQQRESPSNAGFERPRHKFAELVVNRCLQTRGRDVTVHHDAHEEPPVEYASVGERGAKAPDVCLLVCVCFGTIVVKKKRVHCVQVFHVFCSRVLCEPRLGGSILPKSSHLSGRTGAEHASLENTCPFGVHRCQKLVRGDHRHVKFDLCTPGSSGACTPTRDPQCVGSARFTRPGSSVQKAGCAF